MILLKWEKIDTLCLIAKPVGPFFGLKEEKQLDEIQHWCEENKCGLRTSFDMFFFKKKEDMSLFLLKWC